MQGGSFNIKFKPVPGLLSPGGEALVVSCDQNLTIIANYQLVPQPQLLIVPAADLRLLGSSGVTYRIEKAFNLPALSNWNPVSTVTLNSASLTLTNIRPTTNGAGYFRARVLP